MRDLETGDFPRRIESYFEKPEHSPFTKSDELSIGHDARATPEDIRLGRAVRGPMFIAIPHQLARLEFDTTKASVGFIAAAEGIQIALMQNGRGPMKFQRRVPPNLFDAFVIGFHPQKHRTDLVIGAGDEDQIVHYNRIHSVN